MARWFVEAITTTDTTNLCSVPLEGHLDFPTKLIQYVKNSQTAVVIDDLDTDLPIIDEYLRQVQPKSVLCLPILNQSQLIGILYLSNQSTSGVFTSDRILILNCLCTQAAISLTNARLYSDLQANEVRIRESEQRYVTLTEAVPVGIFRTDAEGYCIYVNDRWCQIAGLSPEEAAGDGWQRGLYIDDRERIATEWYRAARENRPCQLECRFQRPDGTITWVYAQSVAERDVEGKVVGYVGSITDISDRKRMEAQLKLSEARATAAFDQAAVGFAESDMRTGKLTLVNPCFCQMTGYSTAELMEMTVAELTHPEDLPASFQAIQQLYDRQIESFTVEKRYIRKNGSCFWAETTVYLVELREEQSTNCLAIIQDISEKKQLEAERQRAMISMAHLNQGLEIKVEERTKSLAITQAAVDWAADCVFLVRPDSSFYYANNTACAKLGYSREELETLSVIDIDPISSPERWIQYWQKIQQHSTWTLESLHQSKDGSIYPVEINARYLEFDGEGYSFAFVRDITERKQTEQIIRQQAEREKLLREIVQKISQSLELQKIFDVACVGMREFIEADRVAIFKFDPDSGYNNGMFVAESVRVEFDSILTKRVHDHSFDESYAKLYFQGKYLAIDDIYAPELSRCYIDILEQFQIRANLVIPVSLPERLWGLLCIHQCTEARHWQEDQINLSQQLANQLAIAIHQAHLFEQLQQQLIQAAKMSDIGQMLTGIAHEINNPTVFLQGNIQPAQNYVQDLLGLIELYQKKMPSPAQEIAAKIEAIDFEFIREDLPKLLGSMNLGIERIRNISQSLRSLSRKDQDKKMSFQIHEGIDSNLFILKHRLKANNQRPKIQVVKNYSKIPELQCFPSQLNQVFMNILANTIDAFDKTNQGKTYGEIEVNPNIITIHTSVVAQNQIQIQIQDNGCGMSLETQQRIFEQGFTTKEVGKGTGLGMAIAHQIITEKHGGTITCDSTIGRGTTFTIALPISG